MRKEVFYYYRIRSCKKFEIFIYERYLTMFKNQILTLAACSLLCTGSLSAAPAEKGKSPQPAVPVAEQMLKFVANGTRFTEPSLKAVKISLKQLPPICKKDCETAIDIYGADAHATAYYVDLDNDGKSEVLLTYRHYRGNGGTQYDLLAKRNSEWKKINELFVVFWDVKKINGRTGLLIESKNGWQHREYAFLELQKDKLVATGLITLERGANKQDPELTIKVYSCEECDFNYMF